MECISFWPSRERGRLSQMHPILDEIKDSELNSKFKIINSKSNKALAHAPYSLV